MSKAYVPNREADQVIIFAGPCSVESTEQFDIVAEGLSKMGLSWIRGGAFKPRTSPYSFQGLGIEGVKIMEDAGKKHGLKTITEVVDTTHVVEVLEHVDGIQIGTRNMANFELLKVIGKATEDSHRRARGRGKRHHDHRGHLRIGRLAHPRLRDGLARPRVL